MKGKYLKHLPIILINLGVLSSLLYVWTSNCLFRNFDSFARPLEFSKLLGISILALLCLKFFENKFHKIVISKIESRNKLIVASIIVLSLSAYKYIEYSSKIINNIGTKSLCSKLDIKISDSVPYKISGAKNLTYEEYEKLRLYGGFPKIVAEAKKINYSYIKYDLFLDDYRFDLDYLVPKEITGDTFDIETTGGFSKSRKLKIEGKFIKVEYSENQM